MDNSKVDLNHSAGGLSSVHSSDTDILCKIPNNFFDPNLNHDKTHYSTEPDFMRELDNFLHTEHGRDILNSTQNELPSYRRFAEPLSASATLQPDDQDLNHQEEVLKRQHFEQLCGILQKKILQYQQKTSSLVKLNQEKDRLIKTLKNNEGLDIENNRLRQKIVNLEQEISETIHLINKFQSKNEILELKIENLTSTSTEMREIAKKQVKDLEVRLMNSVKMEKDLLNEIEALKATNKTDKDNFIKEKHARSVLDREVSSLKAKLKQTAEDRERDHERQEKNKQSLEAKQKKIFTNMMDDFTEKERKLIKELDMQRAALKNYYQSQLETALEEKVTEFQEQLENFQKELGNEADQRERAFSARVMNQMEMIVKKWV